jgi:uncharacterized cupin superfamily protein
MNSPVKKVEEVAVQLGTTVYPESRRVLLAGRSKARLGNAVGLNQFGVNLTRLAPGAWSALRHWHEGEDEFVFVVEGELTLIDEHGAHLLVAGSFAGFPRGVANGHHLVNRSDRDGLFLEVGARQPGADVVHYPDEGWPPVSR